jgi:hypothetical protein
LPSFASVNCIDRTINFRALFEGNDEIGTPIPSLCGFLLKPISIPG